MIQHRYQAKLEWCVVALDHIMPRPTEKNHLLIRSIQERQRGKRVTDPQMPRETGRMILIHNITMHLHLPGLIPFSDTCPHNVWWFEGHKCAINSTLDSCKACCLIEIIVGLLLLLLWPRKLDSEMCVPESICHLRHAAWHGWLTAWISQHNMLIKPITPDDLGTCPIFKYYCNKQHHA